MSEERIEVGCTFVMFRGAVTGRVITCGVCDWCREHERRGGFVGEHQGVSGMSADPSPYAVRRRPTHAQVDAALAQADVLAQALRGLVENRTQPGRTARYDAAERVLSDFDKQRSGDANSSGT